MDDDLDAKIDAVHGSPEAKRRAKVVLRSILGQILDKEACRALGVDQAELEQLQRDATAGLLRGLTPPNDPSAN